MLAMTSRRLTTIFAMVSSVAVCAALIGCGGSPMGPQVTPSPAAEKHPAISKPADLPKAAAGGDHQERVTDGSDAAEASAGDEDGS